MARQSQLLRGVFPVLFHPLPAPVWADDVDNRVNFGMDIGQCDYVPLLASSFIRYDTILHTFLSMQGKQEGSSSRATW